MFYAHWILHLLTSSLKHRWSNKSSLASAYHTVRNFQLLANLNHIKLNNNQISFIYFSLQIICIRLSQTAHLLYELTVVLFVLFGKDETQREQLNQVFIKKKKKIMKRIYCPDVFQTFDNCQPSGAPNDCFLYNICSEKQILPRILYYLRRNF